MPAPEIIGIRHYSPACARLVAARIRALRPHTVLIEGPSDFNSRLGELDLPHRLPIAIFSYYGDDVLSASCHAPFASFSPEWVALTTAREIGARVRFMDLPYWHEGARELPQRYTLNNLPGRERYARVSALLQRRCGVDGEDALWDHLFEAEADRIGADARCTEALQYALAHYFDELRADEPGHPSDQAREAHMREWIAWAQASPGPVLVVCGGWHRRALLDVPAPRADEPLLAPPASLHRHGSYLVPYSELQLDAYSGYGAGMPSPAWYRWQHEQGSASAAEQTLRSVIRALRALKQPLPTAQLVQARLRILGLARLRGHSQALRSDVLDGLLDALVDGPLDAPPPWTSRAPPGRDTDPRLRAALRALAGDRRGALAAGTPQPPLVGEVRALLAAHDLLAETGPRTLELDRRRRDDDIRAQILWRMRVLDIEGFELLGTGAAGAARALSQDLHFQERWRLSLSPRQAAQLIEAGAFGATLAEAAARRIEGDLRGQPTPAQLLAAVLSAVRAGYLALGGRLAEAARIALLGSADFSALVEAGRRMRGLVEAGFWGADLAVLLDPLLALVESQLSWLIEARNGPLAGADPDDIEAVRFLAWRRHQAAAEQALVLGELLHRRALDSAAPPALRGAAAGALWQAAEVDPSLAFDEAAVVAAARRLPNAGVLGDWLIGLFALARGVATQAPQLVAALDSLIAGFGEDEFLAALPALRQAFGWFPPRERAALAEQVARLHGRGSGLAAALLTLPADVGAAARGMAVQARVRAVMQRFGLGKPP